MLVPAALVAVNAILIVVFANQLRDHRGVFSDAIKEAAIARLAHIIMIRFLLSALLLLSLTTSAFGRQTETLDTGKVTASIISSLDRVAPGGTVWVALRTELDEGWHTYWRNPGDSGEPVQLTWNLPQGCLLYTSPSPRDGLLSRMPSSA